LSRLEHWKKVAQCALGGIKSVLASNTTTLTTVDQANIISAVALFNSEDSWSSSATRETSTGNEAPKPELVRPTTNMPSPRHPSAFL
jgi:hypothetical protein